MIPHRRRIEPQQVERVHHRAAKDQVGLERALHFVAAVQLEHRAVALGPGAVHHGFQHGQSADLTALGPALCLGRKRAVQVVGRQDTEHHVAGFAALVLRVRSPLHG